MKKRRVYSESFKREAVELSEDSDKTSKEVAFDLGVSYPMLCKWRSKYLKEGQDAFPGHGNLNEKDKDYKLLERELSKAKEERDILKKALGIFSHSPGRNTNS
ncbi:transposase [Flexistipes sinusarabici]|nr:transposase [Flexistipes sinusarabici]